MKEIKFRAMCAADDEESKMLYFGAQEFDNGVFAWPMPDDITHIEYDSPLMQYTGVNDKFGREIYEGDILKTPTAGGYAYGVVYYNPEVCAYVKRYGLRSFTRMEVKIKEAEVIGNIYEDSELLDEQGNLLRSVSVL